MPKTKIISFEDFKLSEGFYNPFEEEDQFKKKEPQQVKDFGGFFKLKKESFNLGRVEYMKRPGGDYTIIGKTQFGKGEVVEICPVVLVGEIAKTLDKIKDLIFELDKNKSQWGLVLGYGSLYRHSDKPNLDYAYNPKGRQMYFITNKIIQSHQELTINYGSDYWAERTNFNTVAEIPSVNIGLDASTAKPENESTIQPNAADIDANTSKMLFGQPNSNANPSVSGVPIQGIGQQ
jgi:uncharacterized protein